MNPKAFQRAMGRMPRRIPYGSYTPDEPKALPPEALMHFWHPERDGVEPCPADFAATLATIHRDLRMVRPPLRAPTVSTPWVMWIRQPRITHWISPGWQLLFCWQDRTEIDGRATLTPLPLDGRVFANLYKISAEHFGGAKAYFDSIVKTLVADREGKDKEQRNYRHDRAHDYWQSTKIKNIGRGSKFALHHDGTVVPGRGESNWLGERALASMPGDVAREICQRPRLSKRKTQRG